MASATQVKLSVSHHPIFYVASMNQDAADKASELLQENRDLYHMYYNPPSNFHVQIYHNPSI